MFAAIAVTLVNMHPTFPFISSPLYSTGVCLQVVTFLLFLSLILGNLFSISSVCLWCRGTQFLTEVPKQGKQTRSGRELQHNQSWFWQGSHMDSGLHQWGSRGSRSGDRQWLLSCEWLKRCILSLCDSLGEKKKGLHQHHLGSHRFPPWLRGHGQLLQVPPALRRSQTTSSASGYCHRAAVSVK